MVDEKKPKTESGTPSGTGKKSSNIDLAALVAAAQAAGMGGSATQGPSFTTQDATAYVQDIYRQMLGRAATGAERAKAINVFLNQAAETDVGGRQAAIVSQIEATPEFRARQENRYLDAIYNAIAEDVRRAQG
jgi:hypothetical protein